MKPVEKRNPLSEKPMSDDLLDDMIGLHDALDQYDQLSQKLGIPITFKTRSQWRRHSRREADMLALDKIPTCRMSLYKGPGDNPNVDLHIEAELSSDIFDWIYTSNEVASSWKQANCSSEFHLEVLPTKEWSGYLLRLSKRLYPPRNFVGQELGELGHVFIRVTSQSFNEIALSNRTALNCPPALVEFVQQVDQLVLHLTGEMRFISGVFHNGKLTKTRTPRKTFIE
jgi:hypothetical protein